MHSVKGAPVDTDLGEFVRPGVGTKIPEFNKEEARAISCRGAGNHLWARNQSIPWGEKTSSARSPLAACRLAASPCAQVIKSIQKVVKAFNWKGAVGISLTRQASDKPVLSPVMSWGPPFPFGA